MNKELVRKLAGNCINDNSLVFVTGGQSAAKFPDNMCKVQTDTQDIPTLLTRKK